MALAHGQPRLRFAGHFNPGDMASLCYVPKTIILTKDVSVAVNEDFWQAPPGTFIQQAVAFVIEPLTGGTPSATLGVDGNPDALIDATDFDISTAGNWATNIGSATAAAANGLYLPDGDIVRLAIIGTQVTAGKVGAFIQFYEVGDMLDREPHFEL